MGWIIALIVGGVAGWLASMVMNRDASMGIFWNIVVGCMPLLSSIALPYRRARSTAGNTIDAACPAPIGAGRGLRRLTYPYNTLAITARLDERSDELRNHSHRLRQPAVWGGGG
jgi:uncharacterized membrane protein YeaQ/YmgE (transglycosylase-associated protein family)